MSMFSFAIHEVILSILKVGEWVQSQFLWQVLMNEYCTAYYHGIQMLRIVGSNSWATSNLLKV